MAEDVTHGTHSCTNAAMRLCYGVTRDPVGTPRLADPWPLLTDPRIFLLAPPCNPRLDQVH
jgi:hypothetical protein